MRIEELATRIAGYLEPGLARALELLNVEEAEVLAACGVLDAAAPWTPRQRFALRLVATKQEGGPGLLRSAYEAITQEEQTAAKGGRILHNTERALDLSKRMAGKALGIARGYRTTKAGAQ